MFLFNYYLRLLQLFSFTAYYDFPIIFYINLNLSNVTCTILSLLYFPHKPKEQSSNLHLKQVVYHSFHTSTSPLNLREWSTLTVVNHTPVKVGLVWNAEQQQQVLKTAQQSRRILIAVTYARWQHLVSFVHLLPLGKYVVLY